MNLSNECLVTIWSGLAEAIDSLTYNKTNARNNLAELDCLKRAHSIILEELKHREQREQVIKPDWKKIRNIL